MRDNPMARVAHEVMVEAERAFRRADALAAGMEPYLLKMVKNSSIYAYTNDRDDRTVPPGDVLLAAALAAGISLDEKLGVVARGKDFGLDEMRAQIAEMRHEMAILRAELGGHAGVREGPGEAGEAVPTKAERDARRRALARRSQASPPPTQPATGARRGGRGIGS